MRVCVFGAGAIGGYLGGRLAASGVPTTAVARGATLASLRTHGWRYVEPDGVVRTAPVHATDDAAELGPQDVVLLTVKAHTLSVALPNLLPLLGQDTTLVSGMNGVPWWFFDGFGGPCAGLRLDSVDPGGLIADAVPTERVLGAVLHVSCSAPEPGVARRHSPNSMIVGELAGADSPRLTELVATLNAAGLGARTSADIRADVWYKLWGNLTMNPVAALTGATTLDILDDELVAQTCVRAMLEARRIGELIGCPIEQTPEDRNAVTRQLGPGRRPSMLQDADAGRPLELAPLVGAVREIGQALGVPTPTVDALLGLTRLAERVRTARSR
jgi:2-dehydropantoate 2-reductase